MQIAKILARALAAKQAKLVKALFERMPAFSLSHAWVVRDLTTSTSSVRRPIVTINRRVGLPLSKWRGHRVRFCSWLMKLSPLEFPSRLPRPHLPIGYAVSEPERFFPTRGLQRVSPNPAAWLARYMT